MPTPITPALIEQLRAVDTATICNAIEEVEGRRRADGFTKLPVVSCDPGLKPICGFARTATIAAATPSRLAAADAKALRIAYYRYVAESPGPNIPVIQDTDEPKGVGALWGEVNTAIHKGLGLQGALTDGSMRDMALLAPGFHLIAGLVGPSHAFVRVTAIDIPVTVFGLVVRPGDLIHADRHGAVVIDPEIALELPKGLDKNTRREAPILAAARAPGFTVDKLIAAWGEAEDVH